MQSRNTSAVPLRFITFIGLTCRRRMPLPPCGLTVSAHECTSPGAFLRRLSAADHRSLSDALRGTRSVIAFSYAFILPHLRRKRKKNSPEILYAVSFSSAPLFGFQKQEFPAAARLLPIIHKEFHRHAVQLRQDPHRAQRRQSFSGFVISVGAAVHIKDMRNRALRVPPPPF